MLGEIPRRFGIRSRRLAVLAAAAVGALALAGCGSTEPVVVFFQSDRDGNWEIYSVSTDGTTETGPTELANITNNAADDFFPAASYEGDRVAFIRSTDSGHDIWTVDPDGANPVNVTNGSATGEIHSVSWYPGGAQLIFTLSSDGVAGGRSQIYRIGAEGGGMTKLGADEAKLYRNARVHPGGNRIAAAAGDAMESLDIHTMDLEGSLITLLPNESFRSGAGQGNFRDEGVIEDYPDFDPTGRRVLFETNVSGPFDILNVESDGRRTQALSTGAHNDRHPYRSSAFEGFWLALTSDRDGNDEIYILNQTDGTLIRLTNNGAQDQRPTWVKVPSTDR